MRPGRFSTHFPYAVKKLSKEEYLKITTFCQNFIYFLFSNYLIQIVLRLDDPWYPQKISRWDFRFSTHISYGVKSLPKFHKIEEFHTKSLHFIYYLLFFLHVLQLDEFYNIWKVLKRSRIFCSFNSFVWKIDRNLTKNRIFVLKCFFILDIICCFILCYT